MFKKARIKLSFFYVVIIAIGMIIFSVIFYSYSLRDIRHDISRDADVSLRVRTEILHHTMRELEMAIIIANIVILFVLAFLCYILAGKTLEPISRALDAQERFGANASHELRTPLAIMKIENELFLQEKKSDPASARELAKSNLQEIDRMTGMVESLLLLARSKTSDTKIIFEPVDLSELAVMVARRFEKLNAAKKIVLTFSIEPNIVVSGDRKLLEQALSNVVQNAFAYTNDGTIAISVLREGSDARVTISDSGIGIAPKDLGRITEPFFKSDASRKQSPGGMGLGLSIVREIVTIHGGTFSVTSQKDQGTQLAIGLPVFRRRLDMLKIWRL